MADSFQSPPRVRYDIVDNAVEKLSKIQEYLDLGYSTALDIALDIEESNATGEPSPEVENLKQITLDYVAMEEELKQWLDAAKLTKTGFKKEYKNITDSVPSIEDILKSKLSEADMTAEKDLQRHPRAKEFVKQVWNIHHSGQPLPTEQSEPEDSDIMIAQASEESVICPLTQKQMVDPVRSKKCHHSYEKAAIIHHIGARHNRARCPVGGCAQFVVQADLEPNSSLALRIKRLQRKQ